tara:strand:- start:939 stop:1388 length:450 start_codon:yes stop_codon:yes gene_type:complete
MSKIVRDKLIGHVPVDSGQAILMDPCYATAGFGDNYNGQDGKPTGGDYDAVCRVTVDGDMAGPISLPASGHPNQEMGVAFSTGWGDGNYPVYAEFNASGRVMAVHIYFDEDPNDPEPEADECPICGSWAPPGWAEDHCSDDPEEDEDDE